MVLHAFTYPGGKSRHADWIITKMAEHQRYVEPFCGSAGVFFNKKPVTSEVLNDIDGNIVHFFKILRDKPEKLVRYLQLQPFSFSEHERIVYKYYNEEHPQDPVQRAAEFYLLRYSQYGSKTGGTSGFARPGNSIKSRSKSYKNSLKSLFKVADRLQDALIECKDYTWILHYYDHPETLFYIDPPYQGTEHRYTSKTMDHDKLMSKLDSIEGKFMLSYDHKIKNADLHVSSKSSRFHIGQGGREMTEYLYMNYDPKNTAIHRDADQTNLAKWGLK